MKRALLSDLVDDFVRQLEALAAEERWQLCRAILSDAPVVRKPSMSGSRAKPPRNRPKAKKVTAPAAARKSKAKAMAPAKAPTTVDPPRGPITPPPAALEASAVPTPPPSPAATSRPAQAASPAGAHRKVSAQAEAAGALGREIRARRAGSPPPSVMLARPPKAEPGRSRASTSTAAEASPAPPEALKTPLERAVRVTSPGDADKFFGAGSDTAEAMKEALRRCPQPVRVIEVWDEEAEVAAAKAPKVRRPPTNRNTRQVLADARRANGDAARATWVRCQLPDPSSPAQAALSGHARCDTPVQLSRAAQHALDVHGRVIGSHELGRHFVAGGGQPL